MRRSFLCLLLAALPPLLASALTPSSVLADGTSCVMLPPEGRLPAHMREFRREMLAYQPEHPGGWSARTEKLARLRRDYREGLIDEEPSGPDLGIVAGDLRLVVLPFLFANTAVQPWNPVSLEAQLFLFGPTGTMTEYWDEVSYGNLNVYGDVHDWISVGGPDFLYEGSTNGDPLFLRLLLTEVFGAQDVGVDFALYDNDGPDNVPNSGDDDGVVDALFVVHPEFGGECGGPNLWSHRGSFARLDGGAYVTNDIGANGTLIKIDGYCMVPGQSCGGDMIEIGVWCHELGHNLGIKDLYDTDDAIAGDSQGIGFWGLMGSGNWNSPTSPAHMTAWSKHRLGWLDYLVLDQDSPNLCLPPVATDPDAIRLWPQGEIADEYFLVENRQWMGFDMNLKNEGLVIYHVNELVYDLFSTSNRVNANETIKALDVECADALLGGHVVNADHLDIAGNSGNAGDSTDVWCQGGGGVSFTPASVPDSRSVSGAFTGIAVRNVGGCSGGFITPPDFVCASYDVGVPTPVDVCINDCATDNCNQIAVCSEWWASPDIWVDNDGDGDDDYPAPGVDVRLWTRVTNAGSDAAVATTAQIWFARGAMGLVWPDDAEQMVGVTGYPVIDPGASEEASLVFEYPAFPDGAGHYCIGVVLQQTYDQTGVSSAQLTNNIAQVNHQELWDRGSLDAPARSGGCGTAYIDTWIHLYDGENPEQNSILAEVRVGTPPNYNDAVIPPGWNLEFNPNMGPFLLSPAEFDSVQVILWTNSANDGDMAHVPLTLWDLDHNEAIGGTTIDAHVDCTAPAAVNALGIDWMPRAGDHLDGPNVLVEWSPVELDLNGNPEMIQYYEVSRAKNGGLYQIVDRVAVDGDLLVPEFQWYDTLPVGDCPATWDYKIRAVDAAYNFGGESVPMQIECAATPTDVPLIRSPLVDRLLPSQPNPMRTTTTIRYEMVRAGKVEISIYNARGARVRQLFRGQRAAGDHRLTWDGRGDGGRMLPNGVYFTRATLPGGVKTTKIVLTR